MAQRVIDLSLSIVGSTIAFLLSWPYFRDFEYWPESQAAWWLYFIVGSLLCVYVFYLFLGKMRTLFEHDAIEHADAVATQASNPVADDREMQP